MRKTLMVLALLLFVLPLSACNTSTLTNSTTNYSKTSRTDNSKRIIRRNRRIWQRQVAKADVVHSDDFRGDYVFIATSMEQLNNHSKAVVQGTVYKLEKMNSPKNMAYTKASIHVDKVISGDKTLKNQTIYVAMKGGLVSFDHWYANMSKPKDFDHEMLVKNEEFPLPSIGSKVITGLTPNHVDEPSDYNNSLKQSGFTIENSYAIVVPQYDFWVKSPNSKKYVLNNPEMRKEKTRDDNLSKGLKKMTSEINSEYNDTKK